MKHGAAIEFLKVGEGEGFGEFFGAVAAIVVEDDGIVVGDYSDSCAVGVALDYGGGDEFVAGHVGFGGVGVIMLDGGFGGGEFGAVGEGDGAIRFFDALPAIVAVHGPVSAGDCGDLADADLLHFCFDGADEFEAGIWGGIAAVGEGVQEKLLRGHGVLAEFETGVEVFEEAVDAGVGGDAEEVEGGVIFEGVLDGGVDLGVVVEFAGAGLFGDCDGLLVDDSACPDVLMADFAVAHGAASGRMRPTSKPEVWIRVLGYSAK